jgi:amidase
MAAAIPAVDAPHVGQLRAAGGIPFARTNLPDFGLRWHTDNELRGATVNPWDAGRTAGGSSGGEAAALATGMTPLGLGNDYGGSLRWPSQCNGTAALKPGLGRIAEASSLAPEDPPMTIQLFAVQGPMARHVRDLRLAFENMLAPDSRDPWYAPAPFTGPPAPRRVALTVDPGGEGVDPDVAAGVRRAAEALKDAGYEVVEVDPPDVSAARDLWAKQVMTEVALGFKPLLAQIGGKDANAFLETSISVVPDLDLAGYMHSFAARLTLARAWSTFLAEYPLILGPVSTAQPFPVGFDLAGPDEVMQLLRSKRLIVALNLLGLPAVVVPTGVAQGLPQAVEVIGANFREDLCLEAAEAIEERLGVITPIDPR